MSWLLSVRCAETILESPRILPSEEIISIIKRVNPTRLQLSETERELGYQIKNRLQNLLLENYGEAFHLAPHPYRPDIILIKHNSLPTIDACHADLNALSARALATVGDPATPDREGPAKCQPKAKRRIAAGGCSQKEALRNAELLIEQYEYPQAEEILAAIRITDSRDLPVLVKAARALVEEIGAYQKAIDLLLAQPRQMLKDKEVREILARSYYGNGMIPEARAVFDATHPVDLGKDALYAYADISFKDGNFCHAFHLLKLSEEKEGFVTAHASLRKEIEAAMLEEAWPHLQQAEAAFASGDLVQAESLLQHALSLYPNFQKARHLAGEIDALKSGAEIGRLWARFECSGTAEDRLGLLAQLLEQDKENTGRIRALMAQEKRRQKQETVEERLRTLQALAEQENWEPCLDLVLWLSHHADEDSYRHACSISPFFSLLYHNKKLQRHSPEEAMELWLRFVNLKRHKPQGESECCWNLLQELKPYFYSYPLFREEYDRVEAQEQEKAKHEVQQLLKRLEELGEQEETDETDFSQGKRLVAQVRKRLGMLAAEDASWYRELAEKAVYRLGPVREEGESILDYREYLLLGNAAKAEKYRASYDYPGFREMIKQMDDEIEMLFAISAEPITLTVSPEMVVELASEPVSSDLEFHYSSQCHLLFKRSDDSLVVVNVRNMTATQYRSPQFKGMSVVDVLPDKDVFLFVDSNHTLWRATLSGTRSRFTAQFDITVPLPVQEGGSITSLFMSSTKDNVYYLFIQESDQMQVVKQSIDQVSTVESTFAVKGTSASAYRLSYQPDRFVIITDDSTTVLESNLTRPENISRLGSNQTLNCLGINVQRSQIYATGDGVVSVLNANLRAVKQYLKAASVAHITFTTLANVCVEKSTALFSSNGRGMFYNMETNKFSQKFLSRRVLHTETPSRWYYLESDMTKPVIMIKDITDELDTLLEWRVLLSTTEDEEAAVTFVEQFADPDFFSIVKRVD